MLRVLHILPSMNRGGIETLLMNLYRKIDRSQIQFDFLLTNDSYNDFESEIIYLGGKIYRVSPRNKGIKKNKSDLDSFFKIHQEYKIIHQHLSSLSYIEPIKIARKHQIPHRIVHSHNTKQSGSKIHYISHKFNQYKIDRLATEYFACSNLAARWLFPKSIYLNRSYSVINNGIDTNGFVFNSEIRSNKRKELNIDPNEVLLGHVGRFNLQKNHDFLIDIFKSYKDKYGKGKLLLVGEGPLRPSIEEKINQLGLNHDIIFTGLRKDISELMQAMDVFLMPSLHEGLPVTLIEAQATGVSIVLADTITKEVAINDNLAWLSLKDSYEKWALTIEKSTMYDRKSTTKKVIDAGFDIKNIAEELQCFYLNLIKD